MTGFGCWDIRQHGVSGCLINACTLGFSTWNDHSQDSDAMSYGEAQAARWRGTHGELKSLLIVVPGEHAAMAATHC